MKNQIRNFTIPFCIIIAIVSISGCYMSSPVPLETKLFGSWKWVGTYHNEKQIEQPSATLNRYLEVADLDVDAKYDQILRFYTNDVQVDSLFRQITNNSETPSTTDKKNNIVYAPVVNGDGVPRVVRITFFFPKKKVSSNRIRMNIQHNTSSYRPDADTLEMEYLRD